MSLSAISTYENGSFATFLSMKRSLNLLLAQLHVVESFQVLQSIRSLADMTVSSLSSYEQQIASLSQQLCSQIEEYIGFRAHLIEYSKAASSLQARSSLDKGAIPSPISRCPNEVLDYIFQLIAGDGSHKL
ncbi:hypothetical protein FRC14_001041 [Serendipita sp. 396]|nr:hypothetical protein FRC14_001041 [Serendipita sp. 396]KAG8774657.1 hypothetical protein FRC15_001141 [Serendipita sp. 397]KAG8790099.1 hypothetical protein FRC16_001033 [Serendipita sp. 398]KAG8855213.1 hypothetical protein FRC20_000828 [Serendipita sp. 405]